MITRIRLVALALALALTLVFASTAAAHHGSVGSKATEPSASPPVVRVEPAKQGFDWASAAIGAAAAGGVMLIVLAGRRMRVRPRLAS
jgi:hypothetical protein